MTYSELIRHFESLTKAAAALQLPISTVSDWRAGIPFGRQCEIQIVTGGALTAERGRQRKKARSAVI